MAPLPDLRALYHRSARLALSLIMAASAFILIALIYCGLRAYSDHLSRLAEAPRIRAKEACVLSYFGGPSLHGVTEARVFALGPAGVGGITSKEELQLWAIL